MEHPVEVADPHDRQHGLEGVPALEVQKTLSAIFQSTPFHTSKQSQELLQYIVDQTLAGHLEMLKERIIGANVFNRRPDYDTNDDPIVRARAAEVRKRLALYYQEAHEEAVRISVPPGSFRAIFEWINGNPTLSPSAPQHGPEGGQQPVEPITPPIPHEVAEPEPPPSSARFRTRKWLIVIAASAVLLTLAVQHYFAASEERAFDRFWSPVLDNSNPVLIYIGTNAVYELSASYIDAYYQQQPLSKSDNRVLESYIPLPPDTKLSTGDLLPVRDTFVTIGDVAAATKIVSLLVRHNKQFDIRYGNDVVYGDFRQSPAILIGAHNNQWTLSMTASLRYVFAVHNAIQDRKDPAKRWVAKDDFAEDYAVVSRILDSKTGTTVITAAGVGFAGTRAAAEFLTNPQSISELVKSLPKGWEKKNIQIVLHTTVVNQLPGAPDVVATYCW